MSSPTQTFRPALALVVAVVLTPAWAGATDYTAQPVEFQWHEARYGTQIDLGDDRSETIPIGFSFPFYGEVHNTVDVSSNGYLAFAGYATDATNDTIPATRTPNAIIAAFWDNLNPPAGGLVSYQTIGQAPHRRLVVQWTDVPFKNATSTATFQAVLHEGTGYVLINLQSTGRARLGDNHTIGIEAPSGGEGVLIDFSDDYFRDVSFLVRGPIHPFSLSPDCGTDGHYNCYDIPYEFDSLDDEVGQDRPAGYEADVNAPYRWENIPTQARRPVFGLGEDSVVPVSIGFQFPWFERTVTAVQIGSNGVVGFGSATGLTQNVSHRLPDTRSPADFLAALWVDLSPQRSIVYTATVGTPGQRRFIITYDGVPYYGSNTPNTFQVVLYETGGVDINYQVVQQGNSYYVVGYEDATQQRGSTLLRDYLPMSSRSVTMRWAEARPGEGDGQTLWSGPTAYSLLGCDDARTSIDLPFSFPFYNRNTTRLWVSTNGIIGAQKYNQCDGALCGLRSYVPEPIPRSGIPNEILAPGWADFLPCSGGGIYYRVRGQAPNRTAVIEWNNVPNYWNLSRISTLQIVLHENGDVDYHVKQMHVPIHRDHTIGIEDKTGAKGVEISHSTGDILRRSWRLTERILQGCDANALGQPCTRGEANGSCKVGITTCVEQTVVCSEHTFATPEVCDGVDNDCDGVPDDGVGATLYLDADGDSHGDPANTIESCGQVQGYVSVGDDCNDADGAIYPGARERCDNVDNDCNGDLDEGLARACSTRCAAGTETCEAGRWVDCSARSPKVEICDDIDNDCDQLVDENLRRGCATVCGAGVEFCGGGEWSVCDAPRPSLEVCDGEDNDCNGFVDEADQCSCQFYPGDGELYAAVEWAWTGSDAVPDHSRIISTPVVGPLIDDNDDGYTDADDTPSIVFTATGTNPLLGGVLRAVRGTDGEELWTFTDHRVSGQSSPAIGDLDEDGDVEIVALGWRDRRYGAAADNPGLIAVDHEGQLVWTNPDVGENGGGELGSPTIANVRPDLPGNEIVTCFWLVGADGQTIWNQWRSLPPSHTPGGLCTPAVADLDGDGELEIAIGAIAFEADGRRMWLNAELYADWGGDYDNAPAVADLDGDGRVEVVNVRGSVYVLDGATGVRKARASIPGVGQGGPPALADIDGDGLPEIIATTGNTLNAFDYSPTGLQLKWSIAIEDRNGATSSAAAFDFNGNGRAEVVHNDELYLRILDGLSGEVLFSTPNWSGTGVEYPVIADVDGDGGAELLVARNDVAYNGNYPTPPSGPRNGLMVYGDPADRWVGAGRIWNQYAFHPTGVHADGSIPVQPLVAWTNRHLNAWHSAVPARSERLVAPDLTVEVERVTQGTALGAWPGTEVLTCPAWNRIEVRVCNDGDSDVAAGVDVGIFEGRTPDDRMLSTGATVAVLGPGACETVSMEFAGHRNGATALYALVDYAGAHAECEEGNNLDAVGIVALRRPQQEICDLVDNDCDRVADEALTQACANVCGAGTQECLAGEWGECDIPEPATEICDGADNDCDGLTDEGADACGDGGTCVCRGGDVGVDNCACQYALEVNPCGAGCALGTVCREDGCEPWCQTDFDCPQGESCSDDNVCEAAALALSAQPDGPVETPIGACAAGAQDGFQPLRLFLRR